MSYRADFDGPRSWSFRDSNLTSFKPPAAAAGLDFFAESLTPRTCSCPPHSGFQTWVHYGCWSRTPRRRHRRLEAPGLGRSPLRPGPRQTPSHRHLPPDAGAPHASQWHAYAGRGPSEAWGTQFRPPTSHPPTGVRSSNRKTELLYSLSSGWGGERGARTKKYRRKPKGPSRTLYSDREGVIEIHPTSFSLRPKTTGDRVGEVTGTESRSRERLRRDGKDRVWPNDSLHHVPLYLQGENFIFIRAEFVWYIRKLKTWPPYTGSRIPRQMKTFYNVTWHSVQRTRTKIQLELH